MAEGECCCAAPCVYVLGPFRFADGGTGGGASGNGGIGGALIHRLVPASSMAATGPTSAAVARRGSNRGHGGASDLGAPGGNGGTVPGESGEDGQTSLGGGGGGGGAHGYVGTDLLGVGLGTPGGNGGRGATAPGAWRWRRRRCRWLGRGHHHAGPLRSLSVDVTGGNGGNGGDNCSCRERR